MRNKRRQRELLQAAGAPVPPFAEIRTLADLGEALTVVGTPAVLKPVVGAGSMATFALSDGDELSTIWRQACDAYTVDPRATGDPVFILEQRLIGTAWHSDPRYGDYVSVESIVSRGRITHLAVTDKLPLAQPFRETGGIQPSTLPALRLAEIETRATQAIKAIGITNSAVHTELKLTAEGPVVIEVNSRIGGWTAELLHFSAGYDFVQAAAAAATGTPLPPRPRPRRFAAYLIPQPPDYPVLVTRVPTVKDVLALRSVQSVLLPHSVGALLKPERGTTNFLASVIATANSPSELFDCSDQLTAPGFFGYRSPQAEPPADDSAKRNRR